jgi:hypothetical protein
MNDPIEYPLEYYLSLEEKFNNTSNSLHRNCKLYLLYKKIASIYQNNNEVNEAANFLIKASNTLSNLPESPDKTKLEEMDLSRLHFDQID